MKHQSLRRAWMQMTARAVAAWLCAAASSAAPPATTQSAGTAAFIDQVRSGFPHWDADHDGLLTKDEIELAAANPDVKGEAAAAVVALRQAARSRTARLPPLTIANVVQCAVEPDKAANVPDLGRAYDGALARIRKSPRQLFPADGALTLAGLHQGKLGDCFCLAPLGALVARDPAFVTAMFEPGPNGDVTVKFGGGRTVCVKAPTDAEVALMATTPQGTWVNVYEKAVGEYRAKQPAPAKPAPDSTEGAEVAAPPTGPQSALVSVSRGGSAGTMVGFVTGHQIKRFSCKPWREPDADEAKLAAQLDELRGMLKSAFADRRLVCGGTGSGVKVPGVNGNHAYAILNYDATKDVVTLWNPHGNTFTPKGPAGLTNGYPTNEGKFDVPLPELVQFFGGFSFETTEPLVD